ncbi:type IV toxin-antitoxin system AbiEi family antitoxin [Pontibacter lucknowensis]|uniref:Transcriptional regulator, AbiEi antitoxin, Type IV TA system n=1 Tax=Pontibacter lucknowensis TaxID=1077936 RepID=A0A1N6Z9H0_9BACT|nr:type IV toxin-antitoxin system AbiEi family antitoxin [Pontibacter lucknowensis]SIR23428.1 hypothetical protein SAMN05421545_2839 [Pontibacter lucknowensis]
MAPERIISLAIENLEKNTPLRAKWLNHKRLNGLSGTVAISYKDDKLELPVEIMQDFRASHLLQLEKLVKEHKGNIMLVAYRIEPNAKKELRDLDIPYLESNGNLFIHHKKLLFWLEHSKPLKQEKSLGNRAFTKTGLRAIFHFLRFEEDINLPYRTIAEITGTALGNVPNILKGLKEQGFLLPLNKKVYKLQNKKELLNRWIIGYQQDLKPSLHIGTFRFLKPEDFTNWKQLPLKSGHSWWGGEAGADLYTNYLQPEILTIYTLESRSELIKNYRLIPDSKGNVHAYEKFWTKDEEYKNIVSPLLVYVDLMSTGDRRCLETAEKIYHEFLQDKL